MASNSGSGRSVTRKHTTQACDECKRRKSKCNGQQPCSRCEATHIECRYSGVDGRVQRRALTRLLRHQRMHQPPQDLLIERAPQNGSQNSSSIPPQSLFSVPPAPQELFTDEDGQSPQLEPGNASFGSALVEDDPSIGSTHAFLKRACTHLSLLGKAHPREVTREQENTSDSPRDSILILPGRPQASEYIDCFFDHLNATYRYLPRNKMRLLLDLAYDDDYRSMPADGSLALFLSVLACGCIWMASWKGYDLASCRSKSNQLARAAEKELQKAASVLPPSMTTLQAHFAYCQALVACHKFDSAWLALGQAIRLSQIIGLGKRRSGMTPLEEFEWRGLFWSIFMLDRYLAIFLGRPSGINDSYISVAFPEEPSATLEPFLGAEEKDLVAGTVAHIKILQVAGHIMTSLYGAKDLSQSEQECLVPSLELEINTWLDETPSFFHSDQLTTKGAFYSVPWLFKRQQRTVRSAYYLTKMLLYRGCLLHDFTQRIPGSLPPAESQLSIYSHKCREAAVLMAEMAAEFAHDDTYNPAFWGTSHSVFCAIAILVVSCLLFDDRARLESVIENAMKAHMAMMPSSSSQQRKLLEESQSMARDVLQEAMSQTSNRRGCDNAIEVSDAGQRTVLDQARDPGGLANQDASLLQALQTPASDGDSTVNNAFTDGRSAAFSMDSEPLLDLEHEIQKMLDIGFDKSMFSDDFTR